jgi:6-phosphogluconolactonase
MGDGSAGQPWTGGDVSPGQPRIIVAAGPDAVARTAADLVIAALASALGTRAVAHVALTGGSSASGLYRELCLPERAAALDWGRVHLWFGDDRVVPFDHPDSNAGLAMRGLVGAGGPAIPPANMHPMLAGVDASATDAAIVAAGLYSAELAASVPAVSGMPSFDLLLLGMGPDAHVLSVFPDSLASQPGAPTVMPIPAPTHIGPALPRITLGPAVIGAARQVLLICAGAAKAPTVVDVMGPVWDPVRMPAQLARTDTATWLLDPDSAALLVRS